MQFEFASAARILFGCGQLRELGPLARSYGTRAMVVTGRTPARAQPVVQALGGAGVEAEIFSIPGEPTVHDVRRGAEQAGHQRCDVVIGFGGGSALDAAKAVAALVTNPGDLLDYLEVIGRAQPLKHPAAPCLAIPTTAGTGAEVTRNSVLASPEHRFKVSLRSPYLLPRVALVDPELSFNLPPNLTAATGLDALTQLIEPLVSPRANPMTDGFCREGLRRAALALPLVYRDGAAQTRAREDMALASLLSGLALANAGLGAVHGFAAPLGGMYSGPHGAFCAAVLPQAMTVNVRALHRRQPHGEALQRYTEVARLLTGNPGASAEEGVAWVKELCATLHVQPLRAFGVREEDFGELIDKAAQASSMKANPIVLTGEEMLEILKDSF